MMDRLTNRRGSSVVKAIVLTTLLTFSPSHLLTPAFGQGNNPFGQARGGFGGNNSAFNQNRVNNFNEYRQKINAEYISKTREKWNAFRVSQPLPVPDKDVKPAPPVIMKDDEARKKKEDRLVKIQTVIKPVKPAPRPQPVAPIEEVPEDPGKQLSFLYLATQWKARTPESSLVRLAGVSENAVADGWEKLCQPAYNNLVVDCLKLRSQYKLCDWEYLMMLQALSQTLFGNGTNESTLLMAFLFSQSGYKMRLGEAGGKLQMLYASQHLIYDKRYYTLDGDKFYPLNDKVTDIRINEAKYPKEQSLSLWVPLSPYADFKASPLRELKAKRYPDMSVKVSVNKNQMPFYESYPTSEVGGNFMTRWAMYANTPICAEAQKELYPQLKKGLTGISELMCVEKLLNWVQTAFVYKYDEEVWGHDRAFFPDETLYYPYCDCEDRSILFTRLVRDLLGFKCVLVYYPGHLASAVAIPGDAKGDYLMVNGKRFMICDPTYIGASVGNTMPDMNNAEAKVILLD